MKKQTLKLTRSQKDKLRLQKLKEQNPDEWRRRMNLKNEKRREAREKLKFENPEEYRQMLDERKEKQCVAREKLKFENPEEYRQMLNERREARANWVFENKEKHQEYLANERERRHEDKIKSWHNLFDTYFVKNNVEMSQKKWEALKESDINYYGEEMNYDLSIEDFFKNREQNLEFLRNNPRVCCARSVFFFLKTFVHHPYDKRPLTEEEIAWVNSVELGKYSPELDIVKKNRSWYRKEYYESHRESEIEKQKLRKSSDCKNDNLNRRFMDADPNKVLSISDICFNPVIDFNFSFREEFKINLWKHLAEDEKEFFLEKWRLQCEAYEKEVAELSIEYKTEFLNKYGGSNSCGNI